MCRLTSIGISIVEIIRQDGTFIYNQPPQHTYDLSTRIQEETALQWRHNGRHGASKHQPHHCLLSRLFRRRSKKTSKPRVTGLCAGNSPVTGEFPAHRASNAENASIWWRHHGWDKRWKSPASNVSKRNGPMDGVAVFLDKIHTHTHTYIYISV